MMIACLLAGVIGACASLLTGLWCGVGLAGLIALYPLGGTVGFVMVLAVAMAAAPGGARGSRVP